MSVIPAGDLEGLRRQIAATHARFAALGSRLARAAEAITTSGALPPESLLREVQDTAHEFHALRAAVLDMAAALEVLPPALPRDVGQSRERRDHDDRPAGAPGGDLDRRRSVTQRVIDEVRNQA